MREVFLHPHYLDQRSDLPEQYRAIGTEPAVLDSDGLFHSHNEYLDIFDGNSGQLTMQILLPHSVGVGVTTSISPNQLGCIPKPVQSLDAGAVTSPTVSGDGTIYLEHEIENSTSSSITDCSQAPYYTTTNTRVTDTTTSLLTVTPGGSISEQQLKSDVETGVVTGEQFISEY